MGMGATLGSIGGTGTAINRQEPQGGRCQRKRPVSCAEAAREREVEMQHRERRQGGQLLRELQICITADRGWVMVMARSDVFWRPGRREHKHGFGCGQELRVSP